MYVDDFMIISDNNEESNKIIRLLQKEFEINETTQLGYFLGIRVENDSTGIYLSQTEYIEKLLIKHGMRDCNPVNTPVIIGGDKNCNADENEEDYDVGKYQELIGELLYLATRTRPDIAFIMSFLSQYNHSPKKKHYMLRKRVLRYLCGTMYKRLHYPREPGSLKAYSDASWGNAENGRSFSGGAIFLGKSLVLWKSKKQRSVGNSTCEVELFAFAEIIKDVIWYQNVLTELKCDRYLDKPTRIYGDNQASIQWAKNAHSSSKMRHVNLRLHFIRDEVDVGNLILIYVSTDNMIADCFTKIVSKEKLEWCCKQMLLY